MSKDHPHLARTEVVKGSLQAAADALKLPSKKRQGARIVIGRHEWVGLPDLGIGCISAKVDTGAYTSSLHAEDVQVEQKDGKDWVRFVTHNFREEAAECFLPVIYTKHVKSSSGAGKDRIFVMTTVRVRGGLEWPIRVSLADRSVMKCPMLLGRRALSGRFFVDPQTSNVLGRPD